MYRVDRRDRVVELTDIPQSSVGAPIPAVIASESACAVIFYAQAHDPDWDGTTIRVVSAQSKGELVIVIQFLNCYTHMFGPPNDEAFDGHPLYGRGLRPYRNFEVHDSSWLRTLERMNSVHPYHNKQRFMENKHHYVLAFHDSTFECIAERYTVQQGHGSIVQFVSQIGPKIVE